MWGAAIDVRAWLRGLGLYQYEANFRENKIDADMLARLTSDYLKDIRVSALGDPLVLLYERARKASRGHCCLIIKICAAESCPTLGRAPAYHCHVLRLVCSSALVSPLHAEHSRSLVKRLSRLSLRRVNALRVQGLAEPERQTEEHAAATASLFVARQDADALKGVSGADDAIPHRPREREAHRRAHAEPARLRNAR